MAKDEKQQYRIEGIKHSITRQQKSWYGPVKAAAGNDSKAGHSLMIEELQQLIMGSYSKIQLFGAKARMEMNKIKGLFSPTREILMISMVTISKGWVGWISNKGGGGSICCNVN
uniref:Uncharacterized protein n=1 Tax=Romanomermis culicivorax TaxID=13658 RepID=A0A915IK54_ROMCU